MADQMRAREKRPQEPEPAARVPPPVLTQPTATISVDIRAAQARRADLEVDREAETISIEYRVPTSAKLRERADLFDTNASQSTSPQLARDWQEAAQKLRRSAEILDQASAMWDSGQINAQYDKLNRLGTQLQREARLQGITISEAEIANYDNLPAYARSSYDSLIRTDGKMDNSGQRTAIFNGTDVIMENRSALVPGVPGSDQLNQRLQGYFSSINSSLERGQPLSPELSSSFDNQLQSINAQAFNIMIFIRNTQAALANSNASGKDKAYLAVLKQLEEELEKQLKKSEKGEVASEEEKSKAAEEAVYAKEAEGDLDAMPIAARGMASLIYSRGLKALMSGKKSDALVQQQLAKEYAKADPETKDKISAYSRLLSSGKITTDDVKTLIAGRSTLSKVENIKLEGKPAYASEISDIRKADRDASEKFKEAEKLRNAAEKEMNASKKTQMLRKADELDKEGIRLLKSADAKTAGLIEIAKLEADLAKSGAPEPLIKAIRASYRFFGTASQWRGDLLLKAGKFFLENQETFKGKRGAIVFKALASFMGVLSGPKKDSEIMSSNKAEQYFAKEIEPKAVEAGLLDGGAPPELLKAVKAAAGFIGTKEQWRGQMILKAAKIFIENRKKMTGKGGAKALAGLLGLIGRLADPEEKMDEKESERQLEDVLRETARIKPEAAKEPEKAPAAPQKVQPVPQKVAPAPQKEIPKPMRFAGLIRLKKEKAQKAEVRLDKDTEAAANALEQAGAPLEVVKAVREFSVNDPRARAMMLDAANFYAANMKTLTMPQMDKTKAFFETLITGLASGKVKKEEYDKADALLGDAKQFVGGFWKMFKSYLDEAGQKAVDDLEIQRSYATNPLYRRMLESFIGQTKEFEKIAPEEITPDKYDEYSKKMAIVQQAGTLYMDLDDPELRKTVEPFLGRALQAADEGRFDEARLQLMLAKEFVSAEGQYKKFLQSLSADLESGKTDLDSARAALADRLVADADKQLSGLPDDNPAKAIFSKYLGSIRDKGKDVSIDEIQRLSDSKGIITEIAQSDKLVKTHKGSKEGAYKIFERTANAFASGDPIESVGLQNYFARRFILNTSERPDIEAASSGLDATSLKIRNGQLDPQSDEGQKAVGSYFTYRSLSEKYDILKDEEKKLKKGSPEWKLYEKMISVLDDYRKKLANGQSITEDEVKKAEGYYTMFFGSKGDMVRSFGVDSDGMYNTLGHVPSGERQKAAQVYLYAFDAWEKGDAQAWGIYARIGAASASPDSKIRKEELALAEGYHDQKIAPSKAAWYSEAYLEKSNVERNIKDQKLLKKSDTYFKEITDAFDRGDLNGALSGLQIYGLFGENSALGKGFDKEAQEYVDKFFSPDGVFADAKKKGITFANAYAEKNNIAYSEEKSPAIITDIEYDTKSRRLHISEKIFDDENDRSFIKNEKKKEKEYKVEHSRLESKAKYARKKGDETEAVRLDDEASYVDYSWVGVMSGNSKALYKRGVELFDEAIELRKKAAAEPDKAQEYEGQAQEKERAAQKYIAVAGSMLGGLKSYDKSVTSIYTNHRERGRENLHKGISGMSDTSMATLGTAGFNDEQDKRVGVFNSVAGVGNDEVSKQDGIQQEKRRFIVWFDNLEKESKEVDKQFKDVKWGQYLSEETKGGYNHYEYYKMGEPLPEGVTSPWGVVKDKWKIVHDQASVDADIKRGRDYAYSESFNQARRTAKKTEAKLNWSVVAGRAVKTEDELKTGERPYGDRFYDIIQYQKDLEVAWGDIENGNYGQASKVVKNVSDRVTVDGAKQEMDNKAWEFENKADFLDSEKNAWSSFDPMLMSRGHFDDKAAKAYKDYIEYLKTHKATFIMRDKDGTEIRREEYIPFERIKKSYDDEKTMLLGFAKAIKEEIPNVKTVEDVELAKKALREIQSDKDSAEAFLNPLNTKTATDEWIKQGKMTVGGQSYLMVFSAYAGGSKSLADAEQGWMMTKDSYTLAVQNFMPAHYLLRTGKLEKYGDGNQVSANRWIQLADNFAYSPVLADSKITGGRDVPLPEIEKKEIGDVKIEGEFYHVDIPTLIGAISSSPINSYMRMSGENFLGYSGMSQWNKVNADASETGKKVILGSWGYGFDPGGGRIVNPGRIDDNYIQFPEYSGAWKRMNYSDDEKEIILKARTDFSNLTGEFFGDGIKLNDYILTDKSPGYFSAKRRAIVDWGKAVDKVNDWELHKDEYEKDKQQKIKQAEKNRDYYWKKYQETHDYKYYDLQGQWAIKMFDLDTNPNVNEAKKWIDKGESSSNETKDMMKDAESTEHWVGPIKVVGYGITIVATGGVGAFAIGFRETVSSIQSFKFQVEMAGGYDNLSTKEKVLGIGGIGLSALGAISPAFTELGIGAQAPRLVSAMNWTLVGGGIAMSVYQLPDLYKAWQKGEMSGLAFLGNAFANMQPALQIGIFGLSPRPITNPYARFTAAILFGTPLSEHTSPLMQREAYAVEYSKMPEFNRTRFAELETRLGGLSDDEAIGVMKFFKDTPIPMEWAEKMVNDYRKSQALPENVKPEQKGSLAHFEKIPLDKFAEKYEERVAFPEVTGWQFPKAQPEKKEETKPEKKAEQPAVAGEFVIKPVEPEPAQQEAKVIVELPLSEWFLEGGQFAKLHPPEKDGVVQVKQPDGTFVEKPVYHNIQHSENVAKMAYDLAIKRPFTENDAKIFGSKEEKATFLGQVGLLHDVDPTRLPGKPARVAATIEWMHSEEGQKVMREQFKWNDAKILMAEAIIQRTEFPFDNARTGQETTLRLPDGSFLKRFPVAKYEKDSSIGSPENISTRYGKKSPLEHYEDYLTNMKPEERQFVMEEAPVLSEYADKSSWYIENKKDAFDSVKGLGTESPSDMFFGTSGFLKFVGVPGDEGSFKTDYELAKKLGVQVNYPGVEEIIGKKGENGQPDVVGLMGQKALDNWSGNLAMFREFTKEGNDARAAALLLMKEDGKTPLFDENTKEGKVELNKIAVRAAQLAAGSEEVSFTGDFPKDWNNNMASYAAADPARFAVAEYLFDAALRKKGIDPDKVRASNEYGDRMLTIMTADPAKRLAIADSLAKDMPKPLEITDMESGFKVIGIDPKSQIAEDARNWQKILHGESLPSDKLLRYADPTLHDELVRLKQEKMAAGKTEARAETEAAIEVSQRMAAKVEEAAPSEGPVSVPQDKIDSYKSSISGIKTDQDAVSRITEEERMDPTGKGREFLRAAEGMLGLRNDVSSKDAASIIKDMNHQTVDAFNRITREDSPFRERFLLADPTERAIIAEALANGMSIERTFELVSKRNVPKTRNDLIQLSERYGEIKSKSETEFKKRISEMEYVSPALADTISYLSDKNVPQFMKERKIQEWERADIEAKRVSAVKEAVGNRTAEDLRNQEIALIKGSPDDQAAGRVPPTIEALALSRGKDPKAFQKELAEAYGNGGTEGKVAVLSELGVLDNVPLSDRKKMMENLPQIFDLIIRGGLEGQIAAYQEYKGAKIVGLSGEEGIMGTLKADLVLPDGSKQSVFVKHIDLEADRFGADLASANGMVTGKIFTQGADGKPLQYDTGIVYEDPVTGKTSKMQSYGLSEDVHDFNGSKVTIKMPSGRTEDVTVVSVAILGKEVIDPGKRAKILNDRNDPRYEAVNAFDQMIKDPQKREEILHAWHAYHELSRRSLLIDRHTENTAVFFVDRGGSYPEGERYQITFQPIDMDFVAKGIGERGDLRDFNSDFVEKTDSFIGHMSRAWNIPEGALYDQIIAEYRSKAFPEETQKDRMVASAAVSKVIESYDGKRFGLGYDVPGSGHRVGYDALLYGGRNRIIESPDGRMVMYADEMLPLAEKVSSNEAEGQFATVQHDALLRVKESKEHGELERAQYEEELPPLPLETPPEQPSPQKTTPGRKPSADITKPARKPSEKPAVAAGAEGYEVVPAKEYQEDISHSIATDLAASPVKLGGLAVALMKGEQWARTMREALGDSPGGRLVDEMISGKTADSIRFIEAAKQVESGRGSIEFAKIRAEYAKKMSSLVAAEEKTAPPKPISSEPEIIIREEPVPTPAPQKIMSVEETTAAFFVGPDNADYQSMRSQGINSFLQMETEKQNSVIEGLRTVGKNGEAMYLTEMQALNGEAGDSIAKTYSIDKGELVWIYSSAPDIVSARTLLAQRLGITVNPLPWEGYAPANRGWVSVAYKEFNTAYEDNFIFGLITSGNLIGSITEGYPGGKIKSMEYQNGAIGAYELKIDVPQNDGSIETKTVYLKRVDLRPDAAGSEYAIASGIPAPRVFTEINGKDLFYTQPDGKTSRYGLLEDMKSFEGKMNLGGVETQLKTVMESSLADLRKNNMLEWLNSADPKVRERFWEEMGYMLAGAYAIGLWDRHEVNSRAMVMEIKNPLSLSEPTNTKSPTVRDALEQKGYMVFEQDGKTYTFMIGGIDNDAAGSYLIGEKDGAYESVWMNLRFGYVDLHRSFETLAQARGVSVDALVREAFGDTKAEIFEGPLGRGIARWVEQVGSRKDYQDEMVRMFRSHKGESFGPGLPRSDADVAKIRAGDIVHDVNPLNGDPYTRIMYEDGRTSMVPEYELIQQDKLEQWKMKTLKMFPDGVDVVLVEINNKTKKIVPDIEKEYNWLKTEDGRKVAVIEAQAPAVKSLEDSGLVLVHGRRDIPKSSEIGKEDKVGVLRGDVGLGNILDIDTTKAGPVPVFERLMGAGEGFMLDQFLVVGDYILRAESDAAKKRAEANQINVPQASKVPVASPDEPTNVKAPPQPPKPEGELPKEENVPAVTPNEPTMVRAAPPIPEGVFHGEIKQKPQQVKEMRNEPKVVVEEEHGPSGLEDLTGTAQTEFTPGKIVTILSTENHAQAKEAMEAYLDLPINIQLAVYRELHARAQKKAADGKGLELSGMVADAGESYRQAGLIWRQAVGAGELMALKNDVGRNLEKSYGLADGELANAYLKAGSVEDGRKAVAERLGIKADYADDYIFGMLITGNLAGVIKGMYPDAVGIEMKDIGGGATGAYMVKVTDSRGAVHTDFVKKIDMNSDAAGAQNLRLSGIPAPDVITTNASGQPLMYMRPDGIVSKYGISRSIKEFDGTVRLAGKDIALRADKAVELFEMQNSPEIMDIFVNHPEAFWNELGYLNAAGFAVGSVDGHQGNVFGMILDIKNPTEENIKALKDSGFYVFTDAQGTYKMFKLGRIDTDDSAGTYWAEGRKGNFDFSRYEALMGYEHIYTKMFIHLTQVKNVYEARKAGPYVFQLPPDKVAYATGMAWPVKQAADGSFVIETYSPRQAEKFQKQFTMIAKPAYEPNFVSVRGMMKQWLGNGKGAYYEGLRRWMREHDEPGYREAMEDGFRRGEGNPIGVSSFAPKGGGAQRQLQEEGVVYMGYPTNGEEHTPVFYTDGRTRMMSDYEIAKTDRDSDFAQAIPQNKTVYLVPLGKTDAGKIVKIKGKRFGIFTDANLIPQELRGKSVSVMRHGEVIRAGSGFGKITGMKTKKVGAVHVFDYIMDMGERGFVKEFVKIEKLFERSERGAENAFLNGDIDEKESFVNKRMLPGMGPDAFPIIP